MRREYGTDDEHHRGHPEATGNQTLLATEAINSQEKEQRSGYHLNRAIDTRREHRTISLAEANGLEDPAKESQQNNLC